MDGQEGGCTSTRPACSAPRVATAVSISASLRTGMATGSIASVVSGLNMNAARLMPGAISFSRLSHLPPTSDGRSLGRLPDRMA